MHALEAVMTTDPTLGELHKEGKLGNSVANLYGRLLGANWREYPVSFAHKAVAIERERHGRGIDLRERRSSAGHRAA
jgi:hypothetical protein